MRDEIQVQFSSKFLSEAALYRCRQVFLATVKTNMNNRLQEALENEESPIFYSATMIFNQPIGRGFARQNQDFAALDIGDRWLEITAFPAIHVDPTPHINSECIFEVR